MSSQQDFTGGEDKAGLLVAHTLPETLHMRGDGLRLTSPLFAKAAGSNRSGTHIETDFPKANDMPEGGVSDTCGKKS